MNFNNSGRLEGVADFNVYNFNGELPTNNFILSIITPDYYAKYGIKFVNSAIELGERIHLHFINPYVASPGVYELPEWDTDLVTITTSTHPNMSKVVFNCYRFSIVKEIMDNVNCNFWMFDIDGEFIKGRLDYSHDGIGVFVRNKEDYRVITEWDEDWSGTYLAAFYISSNSENSKCIQLYIDKASKLSLKWCSCQGIMYRLYQEYRTEFNFFQIEDTIINIWPENKDEYLFYHYGKGQ
tara:strand:- start:524 stop:1240 length:717 start_codon:yes stop_codon:yes gene_type:complete